VFGVFTSSLLATLLTFTVFLMGSASANLVALGAQSKNPMVEAITRNLYLVLPDLSRLDLKNQAVYGLLPNPEILLQSALYAVLYMVLLLAIATLIFSRRQF
jgi:ABC-type transport system involved in multi-copper enzyme maturation permease subunit